MLDGWSHKPTSAGVDVKTGYIFCIQCNDFIHDAKFKEVHLMTVLAAEEGFFSRQDAKRAVQSLGAKREGFRRPRRSRGVTVDSRASRTIPFCETIF